MYRIIIDTDAKEYGGFGRNGKDTRFFTTDMRDEERTKGFYAGLSPDEDGFGKYIPVSLYHDVVVRYANVLT